MTRTKEFDRLIDQYRIEKKLGQKTFTDCYLAFDVEGNMPVSLEILRSNYVGNLNIVSPLMNRSLALTHIRHPNLAHVIKAGNTDDNFPYIVNNYIEGYPLTERLKQLDRQQAPAHSIYALKLVQQITSALILAERHDLLHYELTPDHILLKNVTLKSDDAVIVIDMAMPLVENEAIAGETAVQTAFISPEQLDGKKLDGRSHIFSLGAILYALLAGNITPGKPVSFRRKTIRQAAGGKTTLEIDRENLAPETYALVDTCLQRNPARRYRSLSQFLEAIEAALVAEERQVFLTQESITSRRPWPFILAILLLIGICIGFGAIATNNLSGAALGAAAINPSETNAEESAVVVVQTTESPTPPATPSPTPTTPVADAILAATQILSTATSSPSLTPTPSPVASATAVATALPTLTPWPNYRIISSSANIRSGPGLVYPVVNYVYAGEIVRILGKSANTIAWLNIETETGIVGWVSSTIGEPETTFMLDDIELAATIPAPPPTATPTPTPTNTPIPTATPQINSGGGGGGGNGGGGPEPPRPTPTPPF